MKSIKMLQARAGQGLAGAGWGQLWWSPPGLTHGLTVDEWVLTAPPCITLLPAHFSLLMRQLA